MIFQFFSARKRMAAAAAGIDDGAGEEILHPTLASLMTAQNVAAERVSHARDYGLDRAATVLPVAFF